MNTFQISYFRSPTTMALRCITKFKAILNANNICFKTKLANKTKRFI